MKKTKRTAKMALALGTVLALGCAFGLAGCGQSASEPGGSGATAAQSAGSGLDATGDATGSSADVSASAYESMSSEEGASDAEGSQADASDSTHGDSLDADKALEGQTDAHPVKFTISAPGYSSSDGKIPIAISGTRSDGTAVDATAYLDGDGDGLELSAGEYTVTVIESPLMDGAKFFRAPGKSWDVSVGDSLAAGDSVSVEDSIVFTEMDLSELTEAEVETAYTYAVSGGLAKSTADDYKQQLLDAAGLA